MCLIRKLATSRVMISFFNDVDVTSDDPRVPAAQYFGTKGFFASYDAKLDAPLTESREGGVGERLRGPPKRRAGADAAREGRSRG